LILQDSGIAGSEESSDSTSKKYLYLIPFDQQAKIPQLLLAIENNFKEVYVDIEMNSLEDAYVNIAKAEEKLHNEHNPEYLMNQKNNEDEEF
jgi:hypothetical protein